MKQILILIFTVVLVSCESNDHQGPTYYYDTEIIVPDSLKEKHAKYVKELISASNFHMTGGDYEDPEDVIEEAERVANNLYGKQVEGLSMVLPSSYTRKFIPEHQLSPDLKHMLDSMKQGGKAGKYN